MYNAHHLDLVARFTFLPLAFSLALLLSCNPCDHLDLLAALKTEFSSNADIAIGPIEVVFGSLVKRNRFKAY